jgi:tetratricopeptide (TPR) repeat protein
VFARLSDLGRDDTRTAATWLNNWGLALNLFGRPLDAQRLFSRAIDLDRAGKTEEGVSPVKLTNYARALRDLGRLDEAADFGQRGYAKAQQTGQQLAINQSLLLLASVYRGLGDVTRAAEMLSQVEPRLRNSVPAGHMYFASLASQQGLVAQARGELQMALDFANRAVSITEESVKAGRQGADYLPIYLTQRSDAQLQLHHTDEAVADAARAVSMLQQSMPAGIFSMNFGRAYLALGRALQAQGRLEEARTAFRPAVEHLHSALGPDHVETRAARQLAEMEIPLR